LARDIMGLLWVSRLDLCVMLEYEIF